MLRFLEKVSGFVLSVFISWLFGVDKDLLLSGGFANLFCFVIVIVSLVVFAYVCIDVVCVFITFKFKVFVNRIWEFKKF